MIAGHRRKEAAIWADIEEVPAIICNMDNDQSVIAMIDSNLQREKILPSEKAFAYKMRLQAMNRQGKRKDQTMDFPKRDRQEKNCSHGALPFTPDTHLQIPWTLWRMIGKFRKVASHIAPDTPAVVLNLPGSAPLGTR